MVNHPNTCARCGQDLNLVDETYSYLKSTLDNKGNELCPRCYQDLWDQYQFKS